MTAVADVSKGQTDMSYKGELQTLTKLSMRPVIQPYIRVHYNHTHCPGPEVTRAELHIM